VTTYLSKLRSAGKKPNFIQEKRERERERVAVL
jgi:hypothetical protein